VFGIRMIWIAATAVFVMGIQNCTLRSVILTVPPCEDLKGEVFGK